MDSSTPTTTLAQQLQDKKSAWAATANATTARIYEDGVAELAASGILDRAPQVGDQMPDFELPNAQNQPVRLATLLQHGPVVLTWYRGGWCPYCNLQLHYLQQMLPQFQAAGATLVALTPELPDASLSTTEKHHLGFEVLTDYNNELARRLGLVFTLNDDLAGSYRRFMNLADYNGVDTDELPLAATYIVDPDFTIRYAYLNPDNRQRAEPADILRALSSQ